MSKKSNGTWELSIDKMGAEGTPVFKWSYRVKSPEGFIQAFPHYEKLLFQKTREPYAGPGIWCNAEEVLNELAKLGWGIPPYIDEIYSDILGSYALKTNKDLAGLEVRCKELKIKWESYIK